MGCVWVGWIGLDLGVMHSGCEWSWVGGTPVEDDEGDWFVTDVSRRRCRGVQGDGVGVSLDGQLEVETWDLGGRSRSCSCRSSRVDRGGNNFAKALSVT